MGPFISLLACSISPSLSLSLSSFLLQGWDPNELQPHLGGPPPICFAERRRHWGHERMHCDPVIGTVGGVRLSPKPPPRTLARIPASSPRPLIMASPACLRQRFKSPARRSWVWPGKEQTCLSFSLCFAFLSLSLSLSLSLLLACLGYGDRVPGLSLSLSLLEGVEGFLSFRADGNPCRTGLVSYLSLSPALPLSLFLSPGLGAQGFPPTPARVSAPDRWVSVFGKLATTRQVLHVSRHPQLNEGNGNQNKNEGSRTKNPTNNLK